MSVKYRPKHVLEYVALRGIGGLIALIPYRMALAVGWGLAVLAHGIVRFRVAEARRRIRQVFGLAIPERTVRRIAWISLRNTCFNAVELMRLSGLSRSWIDRHTDYVQIEALRSLLKADRGALFVVPHTGNWDLSAVAVHLLQFPLFLVVGRQKNPLVDAWLNRQRRVTGIETIPYDDSVLRKVVHNLRAGKILAFMTDLRSRTPGVQVRFLGHDANVVGGMGLFARLADAPIFPIVVTRVGWTRHHMRLFDPVLPDHSLEREEDGRRMTQQVMNIYERIIREEPEQYFWYNKRWILDPLNPPIAATSGPAPGPAAPAG